eukprot:TRINITY_DN34257_c0_g1_i1.p1 TRINITY_DN34257_c0_g1~~TRINITY_DN34257_c0_g1_i1.p1  ORF type:complete len:247 (-),score=26.00 TRINITY_DN34257_c0_g1_i1:18-737(-)
MMADLAEADDITALMEGDDLAGMSEEDFKHQIDALQSALEADLKEPVPYTEHGSSVGDERESPCKSDLQQLQEELQELDREIKQASTDGTEGLGEDGTESTSVFVGNVDYTSTVEDLSRHFEVCGEIGRCTILANKFTGQPMGYAYIEFKDPASVAAALELNGSSFNNRELKVVRKRHNVPTWARGAPGGRGRPFRGFARPPFRGRGRAPFPPRAAGVGYSRVMRPYRPRGRYSPYAYY